MRTLTTDFRNALAAANSRPAILFQGEFDGLTLRLWNGIGNLSWSSQTWLGNGWFHGWSGGGQSDDIAINSVDVVLSGVPEQLIGQVLSGSKQGANGTLYLAMLDEPGAVIASPIIIFAGYLDVPTLDYNVDGPTLTISYETKLVDLDRPREFRYNNETQKFFYPNDTGFRYTGSASEWNGQWGSTRKEIAKKKRNADRRSGAKGRRG